MECRIILVDDHSLFRNGLRELLERCEGCRVVGEAASGEEFLAMMEGMEADIVFMDFSMPGLDGAQTTERALARRPEILVFDDSFSALDYRTDAKLRAGLARDLKDTTRLIVAQRIGTIRDADKIIVLDEGRMVGMGTHEELMDSCDVYREIAFSQLSKEELGHEQ